MRRWALLASLLLAACGGSSGPAIEGSTQGTVRNGVLAVPVSIEGAAALPFVVDTGAPITLVDPARYPSLSIQPGLGTVSTMDIGTLRLNDVQIVGDNPCGTMMCSDSTPAGLIGGEVLSDFQVTIDYRNAAVVF